MTLEEYLAKGIAAYRAEMLKVDPEFFNRPENLRMVERKFGPGTVSHVREMASHRLDRKHA